MSRLFYALSLGLFATLPAGAQIMPATPQEIQQQGDAAIQKSGDAAMRGMTQQQIGQIEQDQRRAQLFAPKPGVYPPNLPLPDPTQQLQQQQQQQQPPSR
jgi:hypothetical protein